MPTSISHISIALILYLLLSPYLLVHCLWFVFFSNVADISAIDKPRGRLFRITHDYCFVIVVSFLMILTLSYQFFLVALICMMSHWFLDWKTKGFSYFNGDIVHTSSLNQYSKIKVAGYPLEPEIASVLLLLFVFLCV